MAKDNVFQDRLGNPQQQGNLSIELGAFVAHRHPMAVSIARPQGTIQLFEGQFRLGRRDLHRSDDDHGLPRSICETQLEIRFDYRQTNTSGIVHKGLAGGLPRGQRTAHGEF